MSRFTEALRVKCDETCRGCNAERAEAATHIDNLQAERDAAFHFIRRFSLRIDPYADDAWNFLRAHGEDRRQDAHKAAEPEHG